MWVERSKSVYTSITDIVASEHDGIRTSLVNAYLVEMDATQRKNIHLKIKGVTVWSTWWCLS